MQPALRGSLVNSIGAWSPAYPAKEQCGVAAACCRASGTCGWQLPVNLLLSTHVKFAPFATRQRRGYLRDTSETDLAVHLETALRGVVIADRWPKSGVDVVVTVLEGEESGSGDVTLDEEANAEPWGLMNVLSGCITVASAAIADAGIDSVDLVAGGAAAIVSNEETLIVSDPYLFDHSRISGACVVGYLPARDEITEVWALGDFSGQQKSQAGPSLDGLEKLIEQAVHTARCSRLVLGGSSQGKCSSKAQAEWWTYQGIIEILKKLLKYNMQCVLLKVEISLLPSSEAENES